VVAMDAHVHADRGLMGFQQSFEFRFGVSHVRLHQVPSTHQREAVVRPAEGMGVGSIPFPDEPLNGRDQFFRRAELSVSQYTTTQNAEPGMVQVKVTRPCYFGIGSQ
jgi:hypothetical protein